MQRFNMYLNRMNDDIEIMQLPLDEQATVRFFFFLKKQINFSRLTGENSRIYMRLS